MSNAAATEKQIPTALIIVGAGLWVLAGFMGYGVRGASNALAAVGLIATVNVVLMIAGAFLTALVLRISFGDLQSAILKLGAIALFPGAVGYLIPGAGGLIALALYFSLLIWFFELEVYQAIVFTIVLFVIRLLVAAMFV
ncbi:MAG TPA: hypothetical protein VLI90_10590 [Tepidisphaeraceae bacterium]|nr:hypothetical protein [Tepidisphaeraceae bacterium]